MVNYKRVISYDITKEELEESIDKWPSQVLNSTVSKLILLQDVNSDIIKNAKLVLGIRRLRVKYGLEPFLFKNGYSDGSGSGYGDGSGYGYGYSDGCGSGYGDGSGYGYGDGSGSGYGYGYGYGDGSGYGYGYGYGDGSGDGDGDGSEK